MTSRLYDDLDILNGTPLNEPTSLDNANKSGNIPMVGLRVAANWSDTDPSLMMFSGDTGLKMMQSHMAVKRAQGKRQGGDSTNSQWSSRMAPVVDLKQRSSAYTDGAFRFNQQTGRLERTDPSSLTRSTPNSNVSSVTHSGGIMYGEPTLSLGVADEYNPLFPNDYEELAALKRERRRAEEAAMASSHHRPDFASLTGMCRRPDFSDDEDDDDVDNDDAFTAASGLCSGRGSSSSKGGSGGAAIAPPSSLIEDSAAKGTSTSEGVDTGNKFGINAVAAKMMARMGYREGQGLGRESQGMSTALMVEKTSRRGGKIIHERDQQQRQQLQSAANLPSYCSANVEETFDNLPLPENRSRVILLRNMCGPDEVDDLLELETTEECAKYGRVAMCTIYELPDAADDEITRIFVEFDSVESATNAVHDLNGRFFAGRVVKAGFYDAEKFKNLELSHPPISA